MPTYDYICDRGHRFEVIQGFNAEGPTSCPVCGSTVLHKAFATPAIHFKGSGWAKKDRGASARTAASNASEGTTVLPSAESGKTAEASKDRSSKDASSKESSSKESSSKQSSTKDGSSSSSAAPRSSTPAAKSGSSD